MRRSKSYDKDHIMIVEHFLSPQPSGPQYNVATGGTVKHGRKISTTEAKQKRLSSSRKRKELLNLGKFNKIESTYAKTD